MDSLETFDPPNGQSKDLRSGPMINLAQASIGGAKWCDASFDT